MMMMDIYVENQQWSFSDANLALQLMAEFNASRALKRAWRHGRAWKMKIRAWKNQDPCFNFYKHIYALLYKYPV